MPNLSYASEKLRSALERIHHAHEEIARLREVVPAIHASDPIGGPPFRPTCSEIQHLIKIAFTNQLVGIAEIHGMLDVVSRDEIAMVDRLLAMPFERFKEWLDSFEHNGELSVAHWPPYYVPVNDQNQ